MKKLLFFMVAVMLLSVPPAWAALLDLTTANESGTINQGYFLQVPDQSTGTGVIDPFVRIQANGTEQGYNTSAQTPPLDAKSGPFTRDLLLSTVPTKTFNGITYYEFLLDINESGANPSQLLSLDSLQIYRGSTPSPTTTNLSSIGTLVYDLDGAGDSTILLNYSLNPGSGGGDMYAYIPVTKFTGPGTGTGDNIYFYSMFGGYSPPTYESGNGIEEWAIVGTSVPVPIPAAAWLLGSGLLGLVVIRRRVKK